MKDKDIVEMLKKGDKGQIVTYGERVYRRMDKEIKDLSLLGVMEKIALQTFKDWEDCESCIVTWKGKEKTYYRKEFEEMPDSKKVLEN